MEHLTASTSSIPYSGENWFDPLENAIRFRVRAFIEVMVEEELRAEEKEYCQQYEED